MIGASGPLRPPGATVSRNALHLRIRPTARRRDRSQMSEPSTRARRPAPRAHVAHIGRAAAVLGEVRAATGSGRPPAGCTPPATGSACSSRSSGSCSAPARPSPPGRAASDRPPRGSAGSARPPCTDTCTRASRVVSRPVMFPIRKLVSDRVARAESHRQTTGAASTPNTIRSPVGVSIEYFHGNVLYSRLMSKRISQAGRGRRPILEPGQIFCPVGARSTSSATAGRWCWCATCSAARSASRSCARAPASRRACWQRGCATAGQARLRRARAERRAPRYQRHRARPLARAGDHRDRRAGTCATGSTICRSTPTGFSATSARSILESLPFLLREERAAGVDLTFEIRLTGLGGGVWTVRIVDGACTRARGLRRARRRPLHGRGARLVRRRARHRRRQGRATAAG